MTLALIDSRSDVPFLTEGAGGLDRILSDV